MRTTESLREPSGRGLAIVSAAISLLSACSSAPLTEPGGDAAGDGSAGSAVGGRAAVAPQSSGPDYFREKYPTGPYGIAAGAVIEDFAFMGWREPATVEYDVTKLETIRLSEFYDPNGTTKLVWINASAVWCAVCRAEMKDIKAKGIHAALGAKGLVMVETLFEDNDTNPARPSDLKLWGSLPDNSIDFPLLLDPGFKLGVFFTSDATPLNMLVDPKTMRVIDATMGYSTGYWRQVEQLLDK